MPAAFTAPVETRDASLPSVSPPQSTAFQPPRSGKSSTNAKWDTEDTLDMLNIFIVAQEKGQMAENGFTLKTRQE
ncbi:MAG: hypothetical protein TREMPRED_004804, partial [Tremellales sp. Tagirdzhanova-0007]